MQRISYAAVGLAIFCACEDKPAPTPAPSATPTAAIPDFSKMTEKQRLAVAAQPCYSDPTCDPKRTEKLIAATGSSERIQLQTAIQGAIAAQVQTALAKKHNTVVRVTAVEGTLHIKGVCTKFVLENFLSGPGKHAKHAGVTRVKCESKAMQAEAPIP